MHSRSLTTLLSVALLVGGVSCASAQDAGQMKLAKQLKVGGAGRWDFITIDSRTRHLYVAHVDRVDVVNADDGSLIGAVKGMAGVHGVALAPELERGFATAGNDAAVTVFDLKTLAVLGKVKTGDKPDAILYDPASKKIVAFDGKSDDFTAFDANADLSKDVATQRVALGGAPEVGVSDGQGHIYVNLEDKSEVLQIDSKAMKVLARWKLAPGEEPTGLAIDAAHHRLFSGCHNKMMVVMDAESGKVITTLPIGGGVDGTDFDPGTGLAFASNGGDGTLTVVKEESPDKFTVLQNVPTQKGARTLTVDPNTHKIYLPSAETGQTKDDRGRPAVVPDSFRILVVE